ncbi:F-actin-monooxygenase MICAL3-like isoform X2 [Corythoichthys intestinalis]|uniref:F-actin-monooxygenase MICAL3-like isoform X2 n=1 Tax=Corythoichthys intestinalis TaxID=161448 RepID=UPI0025A4E09E|nr:F-actin-monooxygenase MICAL3-like isoform X2 [Corythoichthys intestinalis]
MGNQSRPGKGQELFDEFASASTCGGALRSFGRLCEQLRLDAGLAERPLYRAIRRRLSYWKADALWSKLDRRASRREYSQNRACRDATCAVIGAGPCGLRTAVELSFLGARVVVLEKRDSFSRNNVLHLWPFAIHDLRGLGAKKFYGKFCAGTIDHISIRQLQLVLLKVALLLGAEVHVNVEFKRVVEPPTDQGSSEVGWTLEAWPKSHVVNRLRFDVVVGADGHRNTLPGFRRKEFRGKLAIAITANFKNRNTRAEAKVEEIGGVASIFNQKFFQDLRRETGIDLENMVYYKDETHYFVMTAKKRSLLHKGVFLQDFADTERLLSRDNVDQKALQAFARTAADFCTDGQLPRLDFAVNHYGRPDVAVFDFTSMYAAENAAVVRGRRGHRLLVTLVGDSLLEPFWPTGTGVARGFLAALDASWMIRRWCRGDLPLDLLAERESVYRLLAQTTPENMRKNIALYSLDPSSRYVDIRPSVTPDQVRHLVDSGEAAGRDPGTGDPGTGDLVDAWPEEAVVPDDVRSRPLAESDQLLLWCREQTAAYPGVAVGDLTASWKSGLALCALVHRYRPELIDFDSLDPEADRENIRLAFDVCERELGICPVMTVEEMTSAGEPDALSMVVYLSRLYQLLPRAPPPPARRSSEAPASAAPLGGPERQNSSANGHRPENERTARRRPEETEDVDVGRPDSPNAHAQTAHASDVCFFCREKVYAMERGSAEGVFFHFRCFACRLCGGTLRVAAYRFRAVDGTFSCPQRCRAAEVDDRPPGRRTPRVSARVPRAGAIRFNVDRLPPQTSPRSSSCSRASAEAECRRRLSVFSVTSVTRERIELENDRADEAEAGRFSPSPTPFCPSADRDAWTSSSESGSEVPDPARREEELGRGSEDKEEESSDGPSRPSRRPDGCSHRRSLAAGAADVATPGTPPVTAVDEVDDASSFFSPSPFEKEIFLTKTAAGGALPFSLKKLLPLPAAYAEGAGLRGRLQNAESPPSRRAEGAAGALWKAVIGRNKKKVRRAESPPEDVGSGSSPELGNEARRKKSVSADERGDVGLRRGPDTAAGRERSNGKEPDAVRVRPTGAPGSVRTSTSVAPSRPAYVPHALAFERAFPIKLRRRHFPQPATPGEGDGRSSRATEVAGVLVRPEEPSGLSVPESLFRGLPAGGRPDPAERRRPRESARRRAKRRQLKRLRKAQMIHRELQLAEEQQRCLEAAGAALEKHLRGDDRGKARTATRGTAAGRRSLPTPICGRRGRRRQKRPHAALVPPGPAEEPSASVRVGAGHTRSRTAAGRPAERLAAGAPREPEPGRPPEGRGGAREGASPPGGDAGRAGAEEGFAAPAGGIAKNGRALRPRPPGLRTGSALTRGRVRRPRPPGLRTGSALTRGRVRRPRPPGLRTGSALTRDRKRRRAGASSLKIEMNGIEMPPTGYYSSNCSFGTPF